MSAIAGLLHRDGRPADPAVLRRMLAAAPHRGPDGARAHADGAVGLAHQLLRTTPEDAFDEQPLVDGTAGLRLTFAGRLDNRDELIAVLGGTLRHAPDSALVLRAYERWREDCAARLLGDFAFAVWDERRRVLYCARDVMGLRPLDYAGVGTVFVFASEIPQLAASGVIRLEPNEGMVGEYLANAIAHRAETLYRGVLRLAPAHWMTVDASGITTKPYWRFDPAFELRYGNDRDYADHFSALFRNAVACRLRSDRPVVAAQVSGGVDSSSVAGMAGRIHRESGGPEVEAFSLIFSGDPRCDERRYLQDVVRMWGLRLHLSDGEPADAASWPAHVERRLDILDFPIDLVGVGLRAQIRRRGLRVVLTGCGGDHGFGGSLYHYEDLLRQFDVIGLMRQLRADARLPDAGWTPAKLLTSGVVPLLPARLKTLGRPIARRLGWPGGVPGWMGGDFAARVDLEARLRGEPWDDRWPSASGRQVANAFMAADQYVSLEMSERTASEYGLEERHPFFDRRLMEFAAALPENQRWRGEQTKFVVREAMRDVLPVSVRCRPDKGDYSKHIAGAIRAFGPEFMDHLAIASLGWVKQERVSAMYREMSRRLDDGDEAFANHMFPLWMIAAAELWFRVVFRKEAVLAGARTPAAQSEERSEAQV